MLACESRNKDLYKSLNEDFENIMWYHLLNIINELIVGVKIDIIRF